MSKLLRFCEAKGQTEGETMTDEKPLYSYAGIWNHALSPEEVAREYLRTRELVAAAIAIGEPLPIVERNGVRIETVKASSETVRVTFELSCSCRFPLTK